jgi:hypothetical protein
MRDNWTHSLLTYVLVGVMLTVCILGLMLKGTGQF